MMVNKIEWIEGGNCQSITFSPDISLVMIRPYSYTNRLQYLLIICVTYPNIILGLAINIDLTVTVSTLE